MKKHKKLIVAVLCILLAAAWIWRYVSMNKYYDDLDNGEYKLYSLGEMVPFEDDSFSDGDLSGCYIQASDFEVRDCGALLAEKKLTLSAHYQMPEKVALVTVTIKNESSDEKQFPLMGFSLHGVDFNASPNNELIIGLNTQLGKNTNLALSPGESRTLVLAYDLYRDRFGGITWRYFDKCKFYLQVTTALTQKEILVNQ